MKIVSIVGARPQFIKAAMVSREILRRVQAGEPGPTEIIVHTGQHFDENMSKIFFDELDIPDPAYNLGIGGLSHGAMTGRMLEGIESVLVSERPDWTLVYGDTNSTLAAALAASKLHIPVAHVEAGLRSFNARMPEEINRMFADRLSQALFCPTEQAVVNLRNEGLGAGCVLVGDVMYDAALYYRNIAHARYSLDRWDVVPGGYALCTIHREENTDDPGRFDGILDGLGRISREIPIVFPMHPRTRRLVERHSDFAPSSSKRLIAPVSYLEMMLLEANARVILTDSGGIQKEAFFHGVPCITLRDETEWVETIELGCNVLCGADPERIFAAWGSIDSRSCSASSPYGRGRAAADIVRHLWASR